MSLRFDLRINQGETFKLAIPVLDDGAVTRLVEGHVVVHPEVTR
jgi:hypothetical protein